MKRVSFWAACVLVATAAPASAGEDAQFGRIGDAVKARVDQYRDLQMTDEEEGKLGALVSEKVRERYGVVQDDNVHRYVALVGNLLTAASTRPKLQWTFIILDTDAVNAFAAPGGFIHITRGALALMQSEAELAGVLAHELIHVTERHTIRAIQKSKAVQMGANETLSSSQALLARAADAVYDHVIENSFSRDEENESDAKGVRLANGVGYAPQGLSTFLTRLQERNRDSKEKRGLFASHPEMEDRLERIQGLIKEERLTASAMLTERYAASITYKPVPITEIATIEPGTAGLAGSTDKPAEKKAEEKKAEEPRKRSFGLGRMLPTGGEEKKSAQVTSSAGGRAVDPERDAKGGPNKNAVPVTIVAADLAAFKKEGGLK